MIHDRLYKPGADEIVYHYCRPEAFLEIVKSRTIWHSAYSVLNDTMEREWGHKIFMQVAEQLRGECGSDVIDRIEKIVEISQESSVAMISSYSLDADVLSQWRAYTDDGRGFAIGFSTHDMEMPAKPMRVLYDRAAQITELTGNIRHVFDYEKSIGFPYNEQFSSHWFMFGLDLCAYKNPAFAEEMEIRRVHVSALALGEVSKRIIPLGAIDGEGVRRSLPVDVNFRVSNGMLVPYVVLDYTDGRRNSPIKEVVLGPKNTNLEMNIEILLNAAGLTNIAIRRSLASYR
jgi:hypothetical protein